MGEGEGECGGELGFSDAVVWLLSSVVVSLSVRSIVSTGMVVVITSVIVKIETLEMVCVFFCVWI